ncbi:hypothetical protein RA273_28515, partial [Pseudomonas syringae pv. tagetis]
MVSTVMEKSGLYIANIARKLPSPVKLGVWLALALFLCAVFFKLGGDYAKPSVDFARGLPLCTEKERAKLFGTRSEPVVDGSME